MLSHTRFLPLFKTGSHQRHQADHTEIHHQPLPQMLGLRPLSHHTRHSVSTYTVYYTSQFFTQPQVGATTHISQQRKANVSNSGILRIIVTKWSVRTQVWVSCFQQHVKEPNSDQAKRKLLYYEH